MKAVDLNKVTRRSMTTRSSREMFVIQDVVAYELSANYKISDKINLTVNLSEGEQNERLK